MPTDYFEAFFMFTVSDFKFNGDGSSVTFNSAAIMEVRRDSLWSWLVCAASVLSMVIICGGSYNFGLLLPPLMDHFNSTRQATGSIFLFKKGLRCDIEQAMEIRHFHDGKFLCKQ